MSNNIKYYMGNVHEFTRISLGQTSIKLTAGKDEVLIIGQNDNIIVDSDVKIQSILDMNGNKIINLQDPTNPTDAATKEYVDAHTISNALTNSHIYVGNTSNIATDVPLSGDATLANTGAITLVNTSVAPGTYNNTSLTVNSKGLITAAMSGVNTLTNSHIYIGNASNVATDHALSGDATLANTGILTLANTAVTAGSYTSTNITVNSKGLITAASSNANTLTNTHLFIGNSSNVPTDTALSGDATLANTGVMTLANTAVTPGFYTSPNLTIDSKGRITTAISASGGVGGNNLLFNPSFILWQQATSITGTSLYKYCADRWQCGAFAGSTVSQQGGSLNGSFYLRSQRPSGSTSTQSMFISQSLTRDMSRGVAGNALTLTFTAFCGANYSGSGNLFTSRVFTGTGTTDVSNSSTGFIGQVLLNTGSFTLTTTPQRFSITTTAAATNVTQVAVDFNQACTGTAGTNDWYEITDVKLEINTTATPFVPIPYAVELPRCEYFFQVVSGGCGIATSTIAVEMSLQFHCAMRIVPTISALGPCAITNGLANFGQSSFAGSILMSFTGGGLISLSNFTSLVTSAFYQFNSLSNPSLFFNAELT